MTPTLTIIVTTAIAWLGAARQASSQTLTTTLDSNAIMGFETPLAWAAKSSTSSGMTVSSTTVRTQGRYTYEISNPGKLVTLTSAPVASTATALAGAGNPGAAFAVDVLLPAVVGSTNNTGEIQMYVNSPSLNLSKVLVGSEVYLSTFRTGIYETIQFPIPTTVGSAISSTTFSDLTFIFMISSPGKLTGPYLFDNLRVRGVQFVTANASTQPPPGYGGSVDFVVIGGTPQAQQFSLGPVQVPEGFHLKLGTAGTTTVQLELGLDGTPAFTCTYGPDSTDTTGKSYLLISCTSGMQAGDLVSANWAQLTIVGGDITMKLRAQLAQNPVGDQLGGAIIPPMPTFWGDFDGCIPNVAADGVFPPNPPLSASCAAQTAEASQIVTNYFNAVKDAFVPPIWIVTPKPEFARRLGDGSPNNNLLGPPPPNDPDFDVEGHMNPGSDWDAYWRVNGYLSYTASDTLDTTDFFAEASVHAVLFGGDVNVADVMATTSTGLPTDPTSAGQASGSVEMHLLGVKLPLANGGTVTPGPSFDYSFSKQEDYLGGSIDVWIFTIGETLSTTINMDVNGGLQDSGMNVNVVPGVDTSLILEGGVDVVVASGSVDAHIDLLDFDGNLSGDAAWKFNTDPTGCYAYADVSLNGNVTRSSGGGEVDLTVSFLTEDDTWTLFSWDPLTSVTTPLFDPIESTTGPLGKIPTSQCTKTPTITFTQPPATVLAGFSYPLAASAEWLGSCNLSLSPPTTFTWTSQGGTGDSPNPTSACPASMTFNSTGPRTLNVNVTGAVNDYWGRPITLGATSSEQINVVAPNPGPIITGIACFPAGAGLCPQFTPGQSSVSIDVEGITSLQFTGQIVGAPGDTTTAWNVNGNVNGSIIFANLGTTSNTTTNTTSTSLPWTFPPVLSGQSVTYAVTMTTQTTSAPAWGGQATLMLTLFVPTQ